MTDHPGLRQRQAQRTREAIQDAATRLFLAAGFHAVGVDEIAAAAEVSKRTLFKYFPSKEDLVIGAFADHADEPARTVSDRAAGSSPLDALHNHFLDGLARRDPVTGLDDRPPTLAFVNMVLSAPSLQSRLLLYQNKAEQTLAETLDKTCPSPVEGTARLAACQIVAILRTLAEDNRRCLAAGATAQERYPGAVEAAGRAFAVLRHGLADHYD
ncbi:TetR family transcriptional regulator [Rugosimonospora acidiphila]|uniref:TetR family transcriptional regulator n=1 Tax=Rugosimonospora acidiphila TaxID=556531 RepID=A0ABP9RVK4_9ACTN